MSIHHGRGCSRPAGRAYLEPSYHRFNSCSVDERGRPRRPSPFADRRVQRPQRAVRQVIGTPRPSGPPVRRPGGSLLSGGRSSHSGCHMQQGTPSPVRPLLAAAASSPEMEIPLASGRFVQPQAAPPLPPAATAVPISGRGSASPQSETVSTEAAEYSEHARLVSSALSDDGMTPLIQVRRRVRRRVLLPAGAELLSSAGRPRANSAHHAPVLIRSRHAHASRSCCCSASAC